MQNRICSKCKIPKTLDCFYRDKQRIDGVLGWCKECRKKYQSDYSKTEEGRLADKKYKSSELGRLTDKKYRSSEAGKLGIKKEIENKIKNLSNYYVKNITSQGKFSNKIIPAELVELKRISILIKRELKK